jgi:hypothetical protein
LERLGQTIAVGRHKLLKLLKVQKWVVFKHFLLGASTHLSSAIFAK